MGSPKEIDSEQVRNPEIKASPDASSFLLSGDYSALKIFVSCFENVIER